MIDCCVAKVLKNKKSSPLPEGRPSKNVQELFHQLNLGREGRRRRIRRWQMEREEGGRNWMLGWSWLMGCAKEHGIKKVEKVKRDKRRWRVEKRRMRRRSCGIKKEWGGRRRCWRSVRLDVSVLCPSGQASCHCYRRKRASPHREKTVANFDRLN